MNQDVYRIGKCFSHRDCVIKITCKTSPLVSICLSDDLFFVFLSGIFKRWRLRQDWSAQWLMPTSIVWQVHFRTQWVYDFLVFFTFWFGCWSSDRLCSQGIWLAQPKSRVEHNAQNRQQAPFHFFFFCCFGLLNIKSVPREVCEYAQQDSWALYSISLWTYLSARSGRVLHRKEDSPFWRHPWLYRKACTVIWRVFCASSFQAIVATQ